MAYPPKERGIGGKFRRRPSARTLSKPYDRPPTALRGVRGGGLVAGERGGWMSKILDSSSRLIANGAAKLFASLFRRRLTSPPLQPGEDLHSGADGAGVSQDTSTIPLSETRNEEIHNVGSSVDKQKNTSDCDIVELEQLLKHTTFTMDELNRLEGLLRSRTVGIFDANHKNNFDNKGKSVVLASDDIAGSSKVEKKHLAPSNDLASQIPICEASSPAEVAKACMGLQPSKNSSLSGSFRDQVFNEETNLKSMASAPRHFDLSVAPRSFIRSSGEQLQSSKPVGRFAMYRMSRSPYLKVNYAASSQVKKISIDGHSSPASSQWTPNSVKSCGKQTLKRRITAIDDEYGSFGSIRRICQKSNLASPPRIYNSSSFYLEGKKHDSTGSETAEDGTEKNSIILPMQSNENAHKLLQLDKLLPSSPKEKPSKLKAMVIDGSPPTLTIDMLHESALKSTEDIKSFNFLSTEEAGKAIAPSDREYMDEESSLPQCPAYSGMNSNAPQANGDSNNTIPSKSDTKLVPVTEKKSASSSVSLSISEKPAFRISVPEDFFDLDDDEDGNTHDLSSPSTSSPSDSITKISVRNDSSSKTSAEKPFSSLMLSQKDEEKAAMLPVLTGKDNGFECSIASDPSTRSQPPLTPTMLNSKLNTQKDTEPQPLANSESKNVKLSTVATNIGNRFSENAGLKVGEEIISEAIQTTSSSTIANESTLVKSGVGKTVDVLRSPTVASEISTTSTPALFSSEASSFSNPSNSSLNPSPNMEFVPSDSNFGINNSTNTILNSSSLSSTAATFSTTAPTPLCQQSDTSKSNGVEANTFKAPSFSTPASTSQDVSSVLPASSPSINSSNTSTTPPLFSVKSGPSSSPARSSAYSSTPIFGFTASTQSIGSSSSLPETPSAFGSINGSTNSSTLFARTQNSEPIVFGASEKSTAVTFGANNNNSSQNASSVTVGAGNTNSSQNCSMTTLNASNNNSQKPGAITFGGENHTSKFTGFGATDNNSQKPSTITFGAENHDSEKPAVMSSGSGKGSIFGSQSAQSGSGSGQALQASTSQFCVFSSSLGSFGNSACGSASSSPNLFTPSSGSSFSSSPNPFAPSSSTIIFGSSSSAPPIFSANSSSATVFGSSTSSSAPPFQFGSSSGSTASPFTFGSSASGSTTAPTSFTFNSSSSSAAAPFTFNSSSTSTAPAFAFNSSSSNTVSTPAPVFGIQKPVFGFGTNSPNNDQMSMEDSMTDASNQAPAPSFPTGSPGFMFGSPAPQQNAVPSFSFGGAQNASAPFQASGFNPGGSFSLGSGSGGDKSGRKIIKVKRGVRGRK